MSMRWVAAVVALVGLAACGEERVPPRAGPAPTPAGGGGLTMALEHAGPIQARAAVTWVLVVGNEGPGAVTLAFPSGQDGDVVLRQGGQERYRWSRGRFFTQAFREVELAPGTSRAFTLAGSAVDVEPGEYGLEASLAATPAPPVVRRTVVVEP